MQICSITLHGPEGVVSTADTGEAQFVVGTETASDVFRVNGHSFLPDKFSRRVKNMQKNLRRRTQCPVEVRCDRLW